MGHRIVLARACRVSGERLALSVAPGSDPHKSQSLERGVAILRCFSRERQTLGVFEIADMVGISRPTIHRYVVTLVALGYLEQDSKRRYRLSRHAARSAMAVLRTVRRELSAREVLEELRDEVGYTVSMGALDGTRVIYVYRLFGHRAGQYMVDQDLGVGADVPVYCTALGKALLASLPVVERRRLLASLQLVPYGPRSITTKRELLVELERISVGDVVVSDEELMGGARSLAVLIPRLNSWRPVAIEVTVPSGTMTVDRLSGEVGPCLRQAAGLIAGRRGVVHVPRRMTTCPN
jgi:IclR family pca regulon transcriptional regulator